MTQETDMSDREFEELYGKHVWPNPSTNTVYLVVGTCGDHVESLEWPVLAFPTEEDANAHRVAAQVAADRACKRSSSISLDSARGRLHNPYDPDMQAGRDGVRYLIRPVRFQSRFILSESVDV